MPVLLTGTVTFLFTDIEASTHLLQHLGDTRAAQVFDHHRRLLRETFEAGGGHELQDQGDGFLLVFDLLAGVVGAQGQPERAARLGGAAEALRELLSIGVSADEQKRRERYFHPVVASLSRSAFDACWAEGRAMTLQQAFEFALSA